jgi:hypothetical protein
MLWSRTSVISVQLLVRAQSTTRSIAGKNVVYPAYKLQTLQPLRNWVMGPTKDTTAWPLALRLCFHAFGSVTCERAGTAPLAATLAVDGHVRWLLTASFGDHSSALIPFDISKTLEEIRKGKSRIGCIWSILEAC